MGEKGSVNEEELDARATGAARAGKRGRGQGRIFMYWCDGRPSAAFKTETARAGRFCGTKGVDRESTQPRSTSMEARGPIWEQVRM